MRTGTNRSRASAEPVAERAGEATASADAEQPSAALTAGGAQRGVTAVPAADSPQSILALQRSAGNQATGRVIAGTAAAGVYRDFIGDVGNAIGDALGTRTDEERLDAEEELEELRSKTFPPLTDHTPTSGFGLFDMACDMRAGTSTVTLKVAYDFVDGDPAQVVAGFRPEEFKWTEPEKTSWKARYKSEVEAQWGSQFRISSTKPHWTAMVVNTTVVVVEDSADPHYKFTVAKYPPDAGMVQSSMCDPGTHFDSGTGRCVANAAGDESGSGQMDSNDMRPEQKLDWGNAVAAIPFTEGSSALNAAGTAALAPIVTAVAGVAGAHVELTGRASSTHKAGETADQGAISNMDLARARTAAVQAALIAGGATADQILVRNEGESGASDGREWCRVDAQVGTHQTQSPAVHETGHMLGNDDEYVVPGASAGDAVGAGYAAMLKSQTGDVITQGDNENAMSLGSTVQRWNYASFLEGLKKMTSVDDWTL